MRLRLVADLIDSNTIGSSVILVRCPVCLALVTDSDLVAHQAWEAQLVQKSVPIKGGGA